MDPRDEHTDNAGDEEAMVSPSAAEEKGGMGVQPAPEADGQHEPGEEWSRGRGGTIGEAWAGESRDWRWMAFGMFALVVVVGAGLYVFKSLRDLPRDTVATAVNTTAQVLTNVSQSLAALAAQFNQGSISMSLHSTGTRLSSTKYFQFKQISQTEIFTHRDQASTGFGYIPLPEVVVEARAPVQYTYYLNLDASWRMEIHESKREVIVYTPGIHFNKPSVDVSRMEYEVKKGSVLRDVESALENLKKSISSLSYLKARENMELVRETGRQPVEDFVRQWLMASYSDGSNYQVRVFFPGETPEAMGAGKPAGDR